MPREQDATAVGVLTASEEVWTEAENPLASSIASSSQPNDKGKALEIDINVSSNGGKLSATSPRDGVIVEPFAPTSSSIKEFDLFLHLCRRTCS